MKGYPVIIDCNVLYADEIGTTPIQAVQNTQGSYKAQKDLFYIMFYKYKIKINQLILFFVRNNNVALQT